LNVRLELHKDGPAYLSTRSNTSPVTRPAYTLALEILPLLR
jgi:hypothetical protein